MSQRNWISKIRIGNFKAFKQIELNLEGRHLLAYGRNGSGKSSLYEALRVFLRSAQHSAASGVHSTFVAGTADSERNVYSESGEDAFIECSFQNEVQGRHSYRIGRDAHETNVPGLRKAYLASDFVTFHILRDLFAQDVSGAIDLWPVFAEEILPFCESSIQQNLYALWNRILQNDPFQHCKDLEYRGRQASQVYDDYELEIFAFNTGVKEAVDSILREAQSFYDRHFRADDSLEFRFAVREASYDRKAHQLSLPAIPFAIRIHEERIPSPKSFLNEAWLTQIAISIRFGATLAHLQDSPYKLLVLDDLLISLDMSNRTKVVDILLGPEFAEYQKIILTHNRSFFNEIRQRLHSNHTEWCFHRFEGKPHDGVSMVAVKNDLEKAIDYLTGNDLEEAAVCLRKAVETTAKAYREYVTGEKLLPGRYYQLSANLREARNRLLASRPALSLTKILNKLEPECREYLVPVSTEDLESCKALDDEQKEHVKECRMWLRSVLNDDGWKVLNNIEILDELIRVTNRILNPAAHGGDHILYEGEIERAIDLAVSFERITFKQEQ